MQSLAQIRKERSSNMAKSDYIKVVKFGGSSLSDGTQFAKVASIVKAEPYRRYVIPSAPGRRFDGDDKVTDLLYACHAKAAAGKDFSGDFDKIKARFDSIIADLKLDVCLNGEYAKIESHLRGENPSADYVASRGEYLNGILLAAYLGFDFVDAADVIFIGPTGR